MGLFSSEYKTTVGTSISRVVPDKMIISSVKTGLIQSLFGEADDQLVENVLENIVTGMGIRTEQYYTYGKTRYTYGLPSSTLLSSATGESVVSGIVATQVSPGATIEYYHFGAFNRLHHGWVTLCKDYGYNSLTNQLTTLSTSKGTPVYLKNMVVVVKDITAAERDNGSLEQWTTAVKPAVDDEPYVRPVAKLRVPTNIYEDATAPNDHILVTYSWSQATTVVVEGVTLTRNVGQEATINIPVVGYDEEADYFQVKYLNAEREGYWTYNLGTGTYPEIDTIFDTQHVHSGTFFPMVYFRYGKASMGSDVNSASYKTSSKLTKKLSIDYASMLDSINANPGIADIEQAMLTLAVPANTTNPMEQRYLFDFFSRMYLDSGSVGLESDDLGQRTNTTSRISRFFTGKQESKVSLIIQDGLFKMSLGCDGVYKSKIAGTLGKVGTYTSGMGTEGMPATSYISMGRESPPIAVDYIAQVGYHYYRHQISDAVYEEVRVYQLRKTYYVYGNYTTIGKGGDAILLVPLDHSITETYSTLDRELLYNRSLHFVFNSRVVTEVKWYQQDWFSLVMMVVAVVITIYSAGGASGIAASLTAATATLSAFVMFIAMGIIKYVIFTELFKLFVKAVGIELAFVVAIFAALYGGYKAFQAGSITGAPFAANLLQLSTGLTTGISAAISDGMVGLKKEYEDLDLLSKRKSDLLEGANKLLDQQTILSPFVIFGESPTDFYNRTVHSGNIGILGIDSIASYVDIALTLPKFNDTLESNAYV